MHTRCVAGVHRLLPYWQASQSGLSIEQNFTSVAGSALMDSVAADDDTELS